MNAFQAELFNRLVGRQLALVDDLPGLTRDRREGEGRVADLEFRVIDTAGLSPEHTELANRLARDIRRLDRETVRQMIALLTGRGGRPG